MSGRGRILLLAGTLFLATGASPATNIPYPQPRIFPESITVTQDGTLMTGSLSDGTIWRARPGDAAAQMWLDPATSGLHATLGLFADDRANRLWVCSAAGPEDRGELADRLSAVRVFDLKTGASLATFPFPDGAKDLCNDFAIAGDGSAYITETLHATIYRIRPGTGKMVAWLTDPRLKGVDGIAFDSDGTLYVSSVFTGRVFRVKIAANGKPGAVTELRPSRPLDHPDGLRALGHGRFLVSELGPDGGISVVRVKGDTLAVSLLPDSPKGVTSAVALKGSAWGVVAQRRYLMDPKLKTEDPGPFVIHAIPLD